MILHHKRVLITRPRTRAQEFSSALILEGAVPIVFPVTEILPLQSYSELDHALKNLDQYDWLILTSVHGVEAFISRLTTLGIQHIPEQLRVAAVGKKTRLSLAKNNIHTSYVPSQFTSRAITEGIGEIADKRFLLLQSNLSDPELGNLLRQGQAHVDEVIAYQNIPASICQSDMDALKVGVDIITFTSPSSVKGLVNAGHKHGFDVLSLPSKPIIACIGPVTAQAVKDAGLNIDVVAEEHTIEGIIQSVKSYQREIIK